MAAFVLVRERLRIICVVKNSALAKSIKKLTPVHFFSERELIFFNLFASDYGADNKTDDAADE